MKTTPIADRLWRRTNKQGPIVRLELGHCWLWTGCATSKGYGSIGLGPPSPRNSCESTHVVSWKIAHPGKEIPPGMVVRHACDERRCVNPEHLSLGTPLDNSRDAIERGRTAAGEENGRAILTEADVIEMRRLHGTGVSFTVLAEKHGINFATVSQAIRGVTWKRIPIEPRDPAAPRLVTRRRPKGTIKPTETGAA